MNIVYEKSNSQYSAIDHFDSTKSNILILGKADTYSERCNVINPKGQYNAAMLYGAESELYKSYCECISVTNDFNVFTVNCKSYGDYLNVMDFALHYNFSYIVPIGLKMQDTFFNNKTNTYEYYIDYFMYLIENYQCLTSIIMTSNHAKDYEDIDAFIQHNDKLLEGYYTHTAKDNNNYNVFKKNGSDIIFVLNNLLDIQYANVILAAQLSIENYTMYPKEVDFETYYDIDRTDAANKSYAYHNFNHLTKQSSIDNLVNMRLYEDVYKNALIDTMIKSVFRLLEFDEYRGKLYNAYIKLQIQKRAKVVLESLKGVYFKNYEIKNIGFVKTNQTSGYIYIELLVMPYGFMEYIDVVMEV